MTRSPVSRRPASVPSAVGLTEPLPLTSERLRSAADDLLSGAITVTGAESVWSRACVQLLRAALELELDELWSRTWPEVGHACRRAQLLVLPQVVGAELARDVSELWGALSEAGHHRSYALDATSSEVRGWSRSVGDASGGLARQQSP